MNKTALVTIATMAIAAAGVGTVTAVMQTESNRSPVEESVTPEPTASPAPNAPDSTDASPTPADTPNPDRLSTAEYERLRDFPHQPIQLTDEVQPGSEFAQFRQQFQQAVRDRDADFIRPRLPRTETGEIAFGFGIIPVEDLNLDQPNGWFWSVLEKAMSQGCHAQSAESYGIPNVESQVWTCPGITHAFEQQYPTPPNAQGIDHYIDHMIVVGENVNVRAEPSIDSQVVGLLSNEVVQTYAAGWDQIYEKIGDQRPDPINGWTPVQLPNDKTGFVASRYAYAPLDPRLVFGKTEGQWEILLIPAGD